VKGIAWLVPIVDQLVHGEQEEVKVFREGPLVHLVPEVFGCLSSARPIVCTSLVGVGVGVLEYEGDGLDVGREHRPQHELVLLETSDHEEVHVGHGSEDLWPHNQRRSAISHCTALMGRRP